jgi:hypothetical protein
MGKAGIVALACALAALALGCGDSGGTGAPATEAAKPDEPGAAKATAKKQPPAEITTGELPKYYPSDLPPFPDSKPTHSMLVGGSGLIMFTSTAPIADVLAHYRDQLPEQGWTVDEVSESARRSRVVAHKEARKATIVISGRAGVTEIGVSLSGG